MLRTAVLFAVILSLTLPLVSSDDLARPLEYRVMDVHGRLKRVEPEPKLRIELEDVLAAGTVVKTGWFSSAELICADRGAHFKLGPSTRARLAQDAPGLLLDIENGRLRAWFDHLPADQPPERIVTTPSAVLAVRGTEYGVTVARSGETTVTVFSGVVEVTDLAGVGEPVGVGPGQYCRVTRGGLPGSPRPHSMSPKAFDGGEMPGRSGSMGSPDMGGEPGSSGMHGWAHGGGAR